MSTKQQFEIHPVANIFPMMSEDEFEGLKADISEFGQHEAITLWNGLLVDGRNRLRACNELNIEPLICELDESTDPVSWVISYNLHRRHLSTTQRASIASKLATLKHGDVKSQRHDPQNCGSSVDNAASLLNVSPRSVTDAKLVHERGSKALVDAMERDEITASLAAKLVKAVSDKREQTKILADGIDAVRDAVKPATKPPETVWADVEDEPLPVPTKQEETASNNLGEFKKFWKRCTPEGKTAIRIWIDEHFLDH